MTVTAVTAVLCSNNAHTTNDNTLYPLPLLSVAVARVREKRGYRGYPVTWNLKLTSYRRLPVTAKTQKGGY